MDILLNVALTAAGLGLLCLGGHWLVGGSISIARRFGISPMVIGITVVAMGTSAPELAASLAAGENGAIILGNVVGSNVANVGMVVGITAVMASLALSRSTLRREVPLMIGFTLLLVGLSADGQISQLDGAVLVFMLIAFTAYTYRKARRESVEVEPASEGAAPLKSVGLVGLGVALLAAGAILAIDNAVVLAQALGISDRYIGLTVIAIGTSLPELITSVIAVRRGHADIGIGNIIGSNIYNILMIVGVTATISGIAAAPQVFTDYVVMIAFSAALLVGLRSGKIGRRTGILLVSAYVVYLLSSLYV